MCLGECCARVKVRTCEECADNACVMFWACVMGVRVSACKTLKHTYLNPSNKIITPLWHHIRGESE